MLPPRLGLREVVASPREWSGARPGNKPDGPMFGRKVQRMNPIGRPSSLPARTNPGNFPETTGKMPASCC